MIVQLYTFSPGSYVVADEWNANFNVLYKASYEHSVSIDDAFDELAFYNSDLTMVFNAVRTWFNSSEISGNSVTVSTEQEYYKTLSSGQNLSITIPTNMNGECRILIRLQENRSLLPFSVNYTGTKIINHYNNYVFRSGYYYIMIYESNNVAQVKLIWTGV